MSATGGGAGPSTPAPVTCSVKSLITFKNSVVVLMAPELSVPRTVINAGPGEAAALMVILHVVGARPNFMKLATVHAALARRR